MNKLPWDSVYFGASLTDGPQPIRIDGAVYVCYAEVSMHPGVFVGIRDDSDRTYLVDPLTATADEVPADSGQLAISPHYITARGLLTRMARCKHPEPRLAVQQMLLSGIARPDIFGEQLCELLDPHQSLPGVQTHKENVDAYRVTDTNSSPRLQTAFAEALTTLLHISQLPGNAPAG